MVREHVAKSRREEPVPLVPDIIEALRHFRPPHASNATQLLAAEVVKALPPLAGSTHGYAQISGGTGHFLSLPVAPMTRVLDAEKPGNTGEIGGFSGETAKKKLEREKGFEPSTFTLAR